MGVYGSDCGSSNICIGHCIIRVDSDIASTNVRFPFPVQLSLVIGHLYNIVDACGIIMIELNIRSIMG